MLDKADEQFQQEQFLVRQGNINGTVYTDVVFNSGANTLTISVGKGAFRTANGTYVNKAAGSATIATPAVSTTYYLYVRSSDGAFVTFTTGGVRAGHKLIGSVATANPVAQGTLTWTDLRGRAGVDDVLQIGSVDTDLNLAAALLVDVSTRQITYSYNADGTVNVATIKDSGGGTTIETVTYAYNADKTVNTVTVVVGGKTITLTYAYASGRVSGITTVVV